MSGSASSSPRQRLMNQVDEAQLPTGHCRYILLQPELRGHRCGCTHFNLNRSIPGTACECGHLSCYHVNNTEPSVSSGNREIDELRQRFLALEKEHVDLHQLRHDFAVLQEYIMQDRTRFQEVVVRVSQLEESVDKSRNDVGHEVREAYRNLGRAWDSITELEHHKKQTENHFRQMESRMHSTDAEVSRIGDRQLELVDYNITLEERVDTLEENLDSMDGGVDGRREHVSTVTKSKPPAATVPPTASSTAPAPAPAPAPASAPPPPARVTQSTTTRAATVAPSIPPVDRERVSAPIPSYVSEPANSPPFSPSSPTAAVAASLSAVSAPPQPLPSTTGMRRRGYSPIRRNLTLTSMPAEPMSSPIGDSGSGDLWTVHISLLPTSTRPFPFERHTNAYKRCLSRGLHQMVAVNGMSAEAFASAVDKAFGSILRGRKWMPLQALPCTAERLAGLPMLRTLDAALVDRPYDKQFLRDHCAVCDSSGNLDSLYIAMRYDSLSWHTIRRGRVYVEGLERAWVFDPLLDKRSGNAEYEGDGNGSGSSSEDESMGGMSRPPAGDIVATLPSSLNLKRAASEMLRSSSFGSASATSMAAVSATGAAAESEGSQPKIPRIYPLPNIAEVRQGVKTL